jgi:hypothetical protein
MHQTGSVVNEHQLVTQDFYWLRHTIIIADRLIASNLAIGAIKNPAL